MRRPAQRRSLLGSGAILLGLAACSPFTETFQIRTIDTDGRPVQALVIVDGDYQAAQRSRAFTDAEGNGQLTLPLGKPNANISVKGLMKGPDGSQLYGWGPDDPSPYLSPPTQELFRSDPPVQLFVLRRNPAWMPR